MKYKINVYDQQRLVVVGQLESDVPEIVLSLEMAINQSSLRAHIHEIPLCGAKKVVSGQERFCELKAGHENSHQTTYEDEGEAFESYWRY